MGTEPWVVVTGPDDCCGREPVALFTSRAKAQKVIDDYRATVRRAAADGAIGPDPDTEFAIVDVPVDADLRQIAESWGPHYFLNRYLPDA